MPRKAITYHAPEVKYTAVTLKITERNWSRIQARDIRILRVNKYKTRMNIIIIKN